MGIAEDRCRMLPIRGTWRIWEVLREGSREDRRRKKGRNGLLRVLGGRLNGRAALMRGYDRFFWLALYAQPGLWVGLAIFALVRLESPIWLSLNGKCTYWGRTSVIGSLLMGFGAAAIALILTITNTLAFSRCDKFSQASTLASSAMYSGGIAKTLAGGMFSRLFGR